MNMLPLETVDWSLQESQTKARQWLEKSPFGRTDSRMFTRLNDDDDFSIGSVLCSPEDVRRVEERLRTNEAIQLMRSMTMEEREAEEEHTEMVVVKEDIEHRLERELSEMKQRQYSEKMEIFQEADRLAMEEHDARRRRYGEMHQLLEQKMLLRHKEAERESSRRKQIMLERLHRENEMIMNLHRAADASSETDDHMKARFEEIMKRVDEAKLEEQRLEQRRMLQLMIEEHQARATELLRVLDISLGKLASTSPHAKDARISLQRLRDKLSTSVGEELEVVVSQTAEEIQAVLREYDEREAEEKARNNLAQAKEESRTELGYDRRYVHAVQRLKDSSEQFQDIIQNHKALRADIQKAVTLNVNKIQLVTNNMEHALSFLKLFSKEAVPVGVGSGTVSLAGHPHALGFAMDIASKKLLDNVEKLPESRLEEWQAYATVIVNVWAAIPKFGTTFLDNLYARCPFLVPTYFTDMEEATEYINAFVRREKEDQFQFLRRMVYYARLLGVIVSTKSRWQHPFTQERVWSLIAATIKVQLKSREFAEISASVMLALLQTCGGTMKQTYGKVFSKVIHLLCTEYFSNLQNMAKNAPSVSRLEGYLKAVVSSGGHFPDLLTEC